MTDVAEGAGKVGIWRILNLDVQEFVRIAYKTEGRQRGLSIRFLLGWTIPSRREAS